MGRENFVIWDFNKCSDREIYTGETDLWNACAYSGSKYFENNVLWVHVCAVRSQKLCLLTWMLLGIMPWKVFVLNCILPKNRYIFSRFTFISGTLMYMNVRCGCQARILIQTNENLVAMFDPTFGRCLYHNSRQI